MKSKTLLLIIPPKQNIKQQNNFVDICGIIGASIYTGFTEIRTDEYRYDSAYFDAWVSAALLLASNIFMLLLNFQVKKSGVI